MERPCLQKRKKINYVMRVVYTCECRCPWRQEVLGLPEARVIDSFKLPEGCELGSSEMVVYTLTWRATCPVPSLTQLKFLDINLFLLYVYKCFAWMYACASDAQGGHKSALDPLKLGLQTLVSCHVSGRNKSSFEKGASTLIVEPSLEFDCGLK